MKQTIDSKVEKVMAGKAKGIVSGGEDDQLTLEQAEKARIAAENKKKKQGAKKQNNVSVANTYTKVPFYYTDGTMVGIPMKRVVAKGFGLPEMPRGEYQTTKNGRVLGKGIGDFKGKKVRVSRSYILKDRKTPTKGRKTGIGKSSISLTKSYSRAWVSFRVPLDAKTTDVLYWIKTVWSSAKKPDVLAIGKQTIDVGMNKTKADHKAENVAKKGGGSNAASLVY